MTIFGLDNEFFLSVNKLMDTTKEKMGEEIVTPSEDSTPISPVTSSVKLYDKTKIILVIIIILLVSICLGMGGFFVGQMQTKILTQSSKGETKEVVPTRIPPTVVITKKPQASGSGMIVSAEAQVYTDETHPGRVLNVGWQRYVNQRFFYSIEFPPDVEMQSFTPVDNPMTENVVEEGDEGVFFRVKKAKDPRGMDKMLIISALQLAASQKNLTLDQIVNKGSIFNYCAEDIPGEIKNITTTSGVKGLLVRYWIKKNCEGAESRYLNNPEVFFDDRPKNDAIINFSSDDPQRVYFDIMYPTFEFTPVINYSDN